MNTHTHAQLSNHTFKIINLKKKQTRCIFLNAGCPIKVFYNKYIKKHNLFGFGKVFPNHQQIEGYNKIKNGRHETGQK